MTLLRRRPRAVYRVYDEDEYLAGVDPLPVWEEEAQGKSPAGELSHGRKLQRLAGAAALTGAVGTVGGVVGLAGLRTHAPGPREIAQRVMPPARTVAPRGHVSTPVRATRRRRTLHPAPWPRGMHRQARRVRAGALSHGPASRVQTVARAIAVNGASTATAARESAVRFTRAREAPSGQSTEAASAVSGAPAETASASEQTPSATTEVRPRAQSEFGFER